MSAGGPRLARSYPAGAASVPAARAAVCAFAAGAGADELDGVRLAVCEALTNAIGHAYPPGAPGTIHVSASLAGRSLSVIVADDGCGLGAARETRGLRLGLNLIEHTCDSFTLGASRSGGTRLEMRFLLSNVAAEPEPAEALAPRRVVSLNPLRLDALLHDCPAEAVPSWDIRVDHMPKARPLPVRPPVV